MLPRLGFKQTGTGVRNAGRWVKRGRGLPREGTMNLLTPRGPCQGAKIAAACASGCAVGLAMHG